MNAMLAKNQAAARHLPTAHGPAKNDAAREREPEIRRRSETRLQAAVFSERKHDDDVDPYADVPCTD